MFGSITSSWGVAGVILSVMAVLLGGMGLGGLLKVILDHKRGVRKQTDDMATTMVATMTARLTTVERHAILCEANLAHMRHKVNNLSGSFDGFLLLVEMAPERAAEFVDRIKAKRIEDARTEAIERTAILKAALEATGELPQEETIDE